MVVQNIINGFQFHLKLIKTQFLFKCIILRFIKNYIEFHMTFSKKFHQRNSFVQINGFYSKHCKDWVEEALHMPSPLAILHATMD